MHNLSEYSDITDNSVKIYLNGKLMALAQECRLVSSRSGHFIGGFGESSSDSVAVGTKGYTIRLKRVVPSDDAVELLNMSGFEVIVSKQNHQLNFKKCEWIELDQSITKDDAITESATIMSPELEFEGIS